MMRRKGAASPQWLVDRDSAWRKKVVALTESDEAILKGMGRQLSPERLFQLATIFLGRLGEDAEAAAFLAAASDRCDRLRDGFVRYLESFFSGKYGVEYVENRVTIGRRHEWAGVPPQWFVRGVKLLLVLLLAEVDRLGGAGDVVAGRRQALHKLLQMDAHIVLDVCLSGWMTELALAGDAPEGETEAREEVGGRMLFTDKDFPGHLRRELARGQRRKEPTCLVLARLNLPDSDLSPSPEVIDLVVRVMLQVFRESDVVCHLGGSRFAVVLPGIDEHQAILAGKRLIRQCMGEGGPLFTLSMGMAQAGPELFPSQEELVARAGQAMDEATTHAQGRPGFYYKRFQEPDREIALPGRW